MSFVNSRSRLNYPRATAVRRVRDSRMTNVCVNFDKTHAWRPDVHSTGAIALLVGFLVTQTSSAIRVVRLHRVYI